MGAAIAASESADAEGIETVSPVDNQTASPVDHQVDVFEQLRKLAGLHEAGVLTDEEFSQKKADLLARL